ncbi:nitrogenase-stabilizing/protective protein NifW [Raoultella planticola]|uniref:nitrogenase-stabilizing/protective protein NifW n=1 Tax=Klebsiella/Raoultella group TaxID=2890311 RepID=UPI0009B97E9A|nr:MULTISPECIES: nitrogenase-stabilizing/protective protein NifW [Raoultella]EMA8102646.1 nitrogen fixation protein NifW [Klebsiella quasipneumoniae]EKX4893210.1 nitrogen fixation protein NifW [Raoultella ornithinolytica]MCF1305766.1 nitrogenase-stabilizing/protective protein NifW [Raoultella ornithinolytica]MCS7490554.1 nitrogenase-stabilizing/protective protein NifW [Raoultella planticola]MDC3908307.1 nitrogenase-stabilizing/protective protein NifW [Raoultella planticola]
MMEWFYQIPGVDELGSAESFFQFFSVPYQPEQLDRCCLPVLASFHLKLRAEVPLHNLLEESSQDAWLLARRLLAESYLQQFQESDT